MNELNEILDAESGAFSQSFRISNGICRISEDRIELSRNIDETTSFLTSTSFIVRIVLFLVISGLLVYQQIIRGPLNLQYALVYAVPAGIILLSIMGNLNALLYRIRSVLFIALFIWFVYLEYERGNATTAIIYLVFTMLLFMSFLRSFDYSYSPVIFRKDILQVRFINSIPVVTRAYFVVSFKTENGKERKCPILLPGILQKGEAEKKRAVEIMRSAGLLQ
ncbi:MAG: hypothetical protein ABIO46_14955 [Chitinophagales bacterium]